MNEVPEIVSHVIFNLSGYAHHRSNNLTMEQYRKLLMGQRDDQSIESEMQVQNYEREGWKFDDKGIAANLEALRVFGNNFRYECDKKPTPEEDLKSKHATYKQLQEAGIPLRDEQKDILKNFDSKLRKIIAKKSHTLSRSPSQKKVGQDSPKSNASKRHTNAKRSRTD